MTPEIREAIRIGNLSPVVRTILERRKEESCLRILAAEVIRLAALADEQAATIERLRVRCEKLEKCNRDVNEASKIVIQRMGDSNKQLAAAKSDAEKARSKAIDEYTQILAPMIQTAIDAARAAGGE